jgi:hypothetical protein
MSSILRNTHVARRIEGKCLNDDSIISEKIMMRAMHHVLKYIGERFGPHGWSVVWKKQATLHECQIHFSRAGGRISNDPKNNTVFMKPDGGIVYITKGEECYPILIVEDKRQGTNDLRFVEGKSKQSCGNAIERAAKNIRSAEMLFASMPIFPYVIFASGCDFHSSETIAKRLEIMNYGFPNHVVELKNNGDPSSTIQEIVEQINIRNVKLHHGMSKCKASIFVKTHKWNEMIHGSSAWTEEEISQICNRVVDQIYDYITTKSNT